MCLDKIYIIRIVRYEISFGLGSASLYYSSENDISLFLFSSPYYSFYENITDHKDIIIQKIEIIDIFLDKFTLTVIPCFSLIKSFPNKEKHIFLLFNL